MIKHTTCQAHLEWLGVTSEQTGPHSLPSGVYMLVGLLRKFGQWKFGRPHPVPLGAQVCKIPPVIPGIHCSTWLVIMCISNESSENASWVVPEWLCFRLPDTV